MAIPRDMQQATRTFTGMYRGSKLEQIRAKNGGSIMDILSRTNATSRPTLIIGLGGLGCSTVNQIKQKYLTSISDGTGNDRRIHFLAIDTDYEGTLKKLLKSEESGYLDNDEIHSVIKDANCVNLVRTYEDAKDGKFPEQSWIDRKLDKSTVIATEGAHGVRQIGRLGLSTTVNYDALLDKLTKKFQAMNDAKAPGTFEVTVILISGISGGTGSGTIMDVSYMIHKACAKAGGLKMRFDAILYTPDVQQNISGVVPRNLQRNFISAMKEIDTHFKAEITKTEYQFKRSDNPSGTETIADYNGVIIGKQNMFDSCTLVQGYDANGAVLPNANLVAMDTVSNYVINAIGDYIATGDGGAAKQTLQSVLDNEAGSAAPYAVGMQQRHEFLPRDVLYQYRSIGFRSLSFPVEALMTYLANQMVLCLCEEFDKDPSQDSGQVLGDAHIIPANGNMPDEKMALDNLFLLGSNRNIQNNINYNFDTAFLRDRDTTMSTVKASISIPAEFKTDWVISTANVIHTALLNEMKYQEAGGGGNGPYAAIRLANQVTDKIEKLLEAYNQNKPADYYADRIKAGDKYLSERLASIQGIGRIAARTTKREELSQLVSEFNNGLKAYVIVNWKANVLKAAADALLELNNLIIEQNNAIWTFAVGAFNAIAEIMQEDSTTAVKTAVKLNDAGGAVFSKSMLNLAEVTDVNSNLYQLLQRCIQKERIRHLCAELVENMLENQEAWTKSDTFDGVVQLRQVFRDQFVEFTKDELEKFLVVQYAQLKDNTGTTKMTIDMLFEYMDQYIDHPRPDAAGDPWANFENACVTQGIPSPLETAARQIYNEARKIGRCAARETSLPGAVNFEAFYTDKWLCLNEKIPHINQKIQTMALNDGWNEVVYGKFPGVFSMEVNCGLPLYMFKGFQECQSAYAEALHTGGPNNAGMHMDANPETGWVKFPPVLPNSILREFDTATPHQERARARTDYKDELAILQDVKKWTDFCMQPEQGMIYCIKDDNGDMVEDFYRLHFVSEFMSAADRKAAHEKLIAGFTASLNQVLEKQIRISPFSDDPAAEWNAEFEKRFAQQRHSTWEYLINAGYVADEHKLDIHTICPQLNQVSLDDIDETSQGSLYLAIRRSSQFRNLLEKCYKLCVGIQEEIKEIQDRITSEARQKALENASKNRHKEIMKLFVQGVLTEHVQITYQKDKKLLSAYVFNNLNNKSKYTALCDKVSLALSPQYERNYYIYGVFTEFMKWLEQMSTADAANFSQIVTGDCEKFISDPDNGAAFIDKIAPERAEKLLQYLDLSDKQNPRHLRFVPSPAGPERKDQGEDLDMLYAESDPKVFHHMTETTFRDENAGDGFAGQMIGYYENTRSYLEDTLDITLPEAVLAV